MITLYYHTACKQFYARAIPIVLALDQAGAEYEIKEPSDAPPGIGFAIPMITLESGKSLSQTIAILMALGEQYGMLGKTDEERYTCLQNILDFNDIVGEIKGGNFVDKPERFEKWMGVVESRLTAKFFGGDEPSVADYYAVFLFVFVDGKVSYSYKDKFPKIAKWLSDIYEVPVVKKMKESGVSMAPPFKK